MPIRDDWVESGKGPPDMKGRPMGASKRDLDISHYDYAPLGADIESEVQKFVWRWHQLPARVLVPPRYYLRENAREMGVEIVEQERIIKVYIGPRPEHENKRRPARGGRKAGKANDPAGPGSGEGQTSGHEDTGSTPVSGADVSPAGEDSIAGGESQDTKLGDGGDK